MPHHVQMNGSQPAAAAAVRSTSVVDPQHAFEYWHDLVCDTIVPMTAIPTRPDDFTGQLTHAEFGGLKISTVHVTGHRMRRTSQLIARTPG
ncbi:MAG: AraC-type DNA-binding protein, partial [Actinomycetia bacterium]|nr:AraC-type DNA-binding protein [Actinomycetes bacterium]